MFSGLFLMKNDTILKKQTCWFLNILDKKAAKKRKKKTNLPSYKKQEAHRKWCIKLHQ